MGYRGYRGYRNTKEFKKYKRAERLKKRNAINIKINVSMINLIALVLITFSLQLSLISPLHQTIKEVIL